jgi:hypothetical protein
MRSLRVLLLALRDRSGREKLFYVSIMPLDFCFTYRPFRKSLLSVRHRKGPSASGVSKLRVPNISVFVV